MWILLFALDLGSGVSQKERGKLQDLKTAVLMGLAERAETGLGIERSCPEEVLRAHLSLKEEIWSPTILR